MKIEVKVNQNVETQATFRERVKSSLHTYISRKRIVPSAKVYNRKLFKANR